MKRIFAGLAIAACCAANAAEVTKAIVRQQWPWSTDINVEYVVSGVTDPVAIGLTFYRGAEAISVPSSAVTGDVCVERSGIGLIKIDPAKAFGSSAVKISDFKVRLTANALPDDPDEALYKIFDLTSGACTDVTRKDLLNGKWGAIETDYRKLVPDCTGMSTDMLIWTDVTNNPAYKSTHLVMRKIKAKDVVWRSGDNEDISQYAKCARVSQYYVKLTYDYYIAVFETTIDQYKKIMGSAPSDCAQATGDNPTYGPVNNVYYYNIYGHPNTDYTSYWGVVTGEKIIFPRNTYLRDVGKTTASATMWTRTGNAGKRYEFTLPTLAEWEYACMGGNHGLLYTGKFAGASRNDDELAWSSNNSGNAPHEVGTRIPNAYGLYDMLGSVMERVLGSGQLNQGGAEGSGDGSTADQCVIDPVGNPDTTSSTNPYQCGAGSWSTENGSPYDCRHAARFGGWYEWWAQRTFIGFRFAMPAREDGKWADHE